MFDEATVARHMELHWMRARLDHSICCFVFVPKMRKMPHRISLRHR